MLWCCHQHTQERVNSRGREIDRRVQSEVSRAEGGTRVVASIQLRRWFTRKKDYKQKRREAALMTAEEEMPDLRAHDEYRHI